MVISKTEGKDAYRVHLPQRLMKKEELRQLAAILNYVLKTDEEPMTGNWTAKLEKKYGLANAD